MDGIYYASDVRVSLPQPLPADTRVSVAMFGFTFTENGLRHDLTLADHETLSRPAFAPQAPLADIVWGDEPIDDERQFV